MGTRRTAINGRCDQWRYRTNATEQGAVQGEEACINGAGQRRQVQRSTTGFKSKYTFGRDRPAVPKNETRLPYKVTQQVDYCIKEQD